MVQLNVSVPPILKDWVDSRVAEGRYSSASDYVRDLLRRDQDAAMSETEWLRDMIAEGLASGVLTDDPKTIIEDIIAERRARRG
ncbi:type II toxin-antitoxin system ParD family antitoxin [Rhizorhapis sp.]|uniref:type II toxin-antitoxin system ParD family antitoxin n=1 Tax=Rhizorhapis sp. TaxID=1968842 RepID=UPI002B49A952|nr:type II toxin-antitoxin system ParD family antitoxin [Rhizorhapis sp.]HKR16435.1 type II toxin-antitoxin system ParD family antitoxin [Rhizorhapis sp.]